jgi:hypothetical protein
MRADQPLLFEAIQGTLERGAMGEAALVEDAPLLRGNTMQELVVADTIGILAKAQCAPHDVQQHLQLGLTEVLQPHVEQLIGHRRGSREKERH